MACAPLLFTLVLSACQPSTTPEPPDARGPGAGSPLKHPESSPVRPPATTGNPKAIHYRVSKRILRRLYAGRSHETVYGGCPFRDWTIDWSRCCMPRKGNQRDRLEWEHVVPAAAFGRALPEWRDGHPRCVKRSGRPYRGRRCAGKASPLFARMEGDMHNLLPSVGSLNQARGHRRMNLIAGEPRQHGRCDFEVQSDAIEPRQTVRGDIARAYLYMAKAYPTIHFLDAAQKAMLLDWHRADPPSDWERQRNDLIAREQGNRNPFIQ